MVEKLTQKEQALVRSEAYAAALEALIGLGYESEIVKKGAILTKGDGQYIRVCISYCDPTKFDVEAERAEYKEACDKRAAKAEERAEKAREKAEKAAARAAAKAAKEADAQ